MADLDRRRSALVTALAATQLDTPPGFRHEGVDAVKAWLGTWDGLGIVIVGVARQGYDLELRQFPHAGVLSSTRPASRIRSCTAQGGTRRHGPRCRRRPWRRSCGENRPTCRRLKKSHRSSDYALPDPPVLALSARCR
jgi:hypothetical protein